MSESSLTALTRRSFVPHTRTILEYPTQLSGLISLTFAAFCRFPGYVPPTVPAPLPNLMFLVLESPWIMTLRLFLWLMQRKVRENLTWTKTLQEVYEQKANEKKDEYSERVLNVCYPPQLTHI